MEQITFTVIITTYNRPGLLKRAINSINNLNWLPQEIIIIDDASNDKIENPKQLTTLNLQYYFLKTNQGPCVARNLGIRLASNNWIVIMDDDDELLSDALNIIANKINSNQEAKNYPVLNFQTTNTSLKLQNNYVLLTLNDYLRSEIKGDFTPVINKKKYMKYNLRYPELKIGGESLLWWSVAKQYGIPSWNNVVCKVNKDAPDRLTSIQSKIKNALLLADYQEYKLIQFGSILDNYPLQKIKIMRGLITYLLLSGQSQSVANKLNLYFSHPIYLKDRFIFKILHYLPGWLIKLLFRMYHHYRLRF